MRFGRIVERLAAGAAMAVVSVVAVQAAVDHSWRVAQRESALR
jgi:hypothetical protein